jgi:DNA-3-methyladenine glycosylase
MLPARFFQATTLRVARSLLGKVLVHRVGPNDVRSGRIVEVEAYLGPKDLACHTSKGRTARTEVMYGPPGTSYVFLVYGMHHCFNVVTGNGEAVLIRALEPLSPGLRHTHGPGRLCKAMGIDLRLNGVSLLGTSPLWLEAGEPVLKVKRGPRIGVDYAGEWAKKPWRFWDETSRHVSVT